MRKKHRHLGEHTPLRAACLRSRGFNAHHDIAENVSLEARGFALAHGKREDIGRPIEVPVNLVELLDLIIVS
jgi:hypothetical protein